MPTIVIAPLGSIHKELLQTQVQISETLSCPFYPLIQRIDLDGIKGEGHHTEGCSDLCWYGDCFLPLVLFVESLIPQFRVSVQIETFFNQIRRQNQHCCQCLHQRFFLEAKFVSSVRFHLMIPGL